MADKQKRIMILEDDPTRVTWFYKNFLNDILVVTNSAVDAERILDTTFFDLICLDHDLGGEVFVDSSERNTGFQVAKHIPKTLNQNTQVIIHSYNHPAAKRMGEFLDSSEEYGGVVTVAPFMTWDGYGEPNSGILL